MQKNTNHRLRWPNPFLYFQLVLKAWRPYPQLREKPTFYNPSRGSGPTHTFKLHWTLYPMHRPLMSCYVIVGGGHAIAPLIIWLISLPQAMGVAPTCGSPRSVTSFSINWYLHFHKCSLHTVHHYVFNFQDTMGSVCIVCWELDWNSPWMVSLCSCSSGGRAGRLLTGRLDPSLL